MQMFDTAIISCELSGPQHLFISCSRGTSVWLLRSGVIIDVETK